MPPFRANILNQTLVDAHLERIPGLATLAARRFAGRHLQVLSRQADRALNAQVFRAGALDQLAADLLEGLDIARGQGDADAVDFLFFI